MNRLLLAIVIGLLGCAGPVEVEDCDPDAPLVVMDDGSFTQIKAFREEHPGLLCPWITVMEVDGVPWVRYTCYPTCGDGEAAR